MIALLLGLALCAHPVEALNERSPIVSPSGWRGFVPIESAALDRVEADVHPSGKGAIVAASHGRYGGASLYLVTESGEVRELWRTSEYERLSRPVWAPDGASFAVVLRQAPRWLPGALPVLQFQGSLVLANAAGAQRTVSALTDAARVLGFDGSGAAIVTRYLPGDLPEERPWRLDLQTGIATGILPDDAHVYSLAMFGSRLYFARTAAAVVTLPAPLQQVELVEADLAGHERVLAIEIGGLPSNLKLEDGVLRYLCEGAKREVAVELSTLTVRRVPQKIPSRQVDAAGQYLDMPYIHQVYDTPDDFAGEWACGPTSTLMAIQHFNRLAAWPITASWPTPHTSDYGAYDAYTYTAYGTTFNRVQNDAHGNPATGAYGWCTDGGGAWASRMQDFASKHNLSSDFDGSPSFSSVQGYLDAGKAVPLSTYLTSAGHIVAAKGYTAGGLTVVNDPYGDKNQGYMNYSGETAQYTWATMDPVWLVTVYGTVTPTTPPYQATWISQDYPATMVGGTQAPASLTYRNDGTATWDGNTHLGTTVPRDRASPFFTAGEWLGADRPAASASTAPGSENSFSFTLSAPEVCTPTTYTEHFNLVQESTAWFSDSGQGGPADDAVWFKITVNPAPGACQDAGAPGPDAAPIAPPGPDAGAVVPPGEDAGPIVVHPGEDAGAIVIHPGEDAGAVAHADDGGSVIAARADAGAHAEPEAPVHAGCSCSAGATPPLVGLWVLALGLLRRRRH